MRGQSHLRLISVAALLLCHNGWAKQAPVSRELKGGKSTATAAKAPKAGSSPKAPKAGSSSKASKVVKSPKAPNAPKASKSGKSTVTTTVTCDATCQTTAVSTAITGFSDSLFGSLLSGISANAVVTAPISEASTGTITATVDGQALTLTDLTVVTSSNAVTLTDVQGDSDYAAASNAVKAAVEAGLAGGYTAFASSGTATGSRLAQSELLAVAYGSSSDANKSVKFFPNYLNPVNVLASVVFTTARRRMQQQFLERSLQSASFPRECNACPAGTNLQVNVNCRTQALSTFTTSLSSATGLFLKEVMIAVRFCAAVQEAEPGGETFSTCFDRKVATPTATYSASVATNGQAYVTTDQNDCCTCLMPKTAP